MVAARQPTKIIQAGGTSFTLIREPRGGKSLPGLAALLVNNRSSWRTARSGSVGLHEMAATVLLPAGLAALVAEGLLLAEADGAEAVGRNAQRNEVLLHGCGAAIGTNVGLVKVEIGIAHFSQKEFVVRGPLWRRRRRRRIHRDGCGGAGGAAGTGGGNRVSSGVGWGDLSGSLSSHGADLGRDVKLRSIGGIPAQGR